MSMMSSGSWIGKQKDPPGFQLQSDGTRKLVISLKTIKKGQFVMQLPGTIIPNREALLRKAKYQKRKLEPRLRNFTYKGKTMCIDSTLCKQLGGRIQECTGEESSNVKIDVIHAGGQTHVIYMTTREILPGDALFLPSVTQCGDRQPFLKIADSTGKFAPLFKTWDVFPAPEFPEQTPKSGSVRKRKCTERGFCELCNSHYTNLQKHLSSEGHKCETEKNEIIKGQQPISMRMLKLGTDVDSLVDKIIAQDVKEVVEAAVLQVVENSLLLDSLQHTPDEDTIASEKTDIETTYDDSDADRDYIPESESTSSEECEMNLDLESEIVPIQSPLEEEHETNQYLEIKTVPRQSPLEEAKATKKQFTNISYTKPKRPCPYCRKEQSRLRRHLRTKHRNEPTVRAIEKLPKTSKAAAYDKLRKKAIYAINQERMVSKQPVMQERMQGQHNEIVMCNFCKGFYSNNSFYKHQKTCTAKEETTFPFAKQKLYHLQLAAKSNSHSIEPTPFETEILTKFRNDEVGNLCREDTFIKNYGQKEWLSSGEKNKQSTMSNMRGLGNLLIAFRKETQDNTLSGESLIDRTKFDSLSKAVVTVTESADGEERAAQRVKLGYAIKSAVNSMAAVYAMDTNIERGAKKIKETEMFLLILNHNWGPLFVPSQRKLAERRSSVLRKPSALPLEEDVSHIKDYLEADIQEMVKDPYLHWGQYDYNRLRARVVTRLTLYNARRGGEPARLLLSEWSAARNGEWVDPHLVEKIDDPLEKSLASHALLAHQAGKGGRTLVPLLIPNNIIPAIELLVQTREDAGVARDNPYLFANTQGSADHCRGWDAVREVAVAANLKQPQTITATAMRHRASTYYALLDVSQSERAWFLKHMGHSEEVSTNVYTTPPSYMEICKVGRFFDALDKGMLTSATTRIPEMQSENKQIGNISAQPSSQEQAQQPIGEVRRTQSCNTDSVKRVMWKPDEELKVMEHFHTNIIKEKVPNKKEVKDFFERYPCQNDGDWKRVKNKVYNEIQRRRRPIKSK